MTFWGIRSIITLHRFLQFVLILWAVTLNPSLANAKTELCLLAPYGVEVAYAYASSRKKYWVVDGWWKIDPGKCLELKPSATNEYYYYAKVRPDDFVASHLSSLEIEWRGVIDDEKSAHICIPPDRSIDDIDGREVDNCARNDIRPLFAYFKATTENFKFLLSLNTEDLEKIGYDPQTLDDAGEVANILVKQMQYTDGLASEPMGTPFRLGLKTIETEYGLFVQEVIPGMPNQYEFFPGDRIVAINGTTIQTKLDLVYALQELGYKNLPHNRYATLTIDRGIDRGKIKLTPKCIEGQSVCMVYFRFLDPRVQQNAAAAMVRGTAGGVFWGFDGHVFCFAKAVIESLNDVDYAVRDKTCLQRLKGQREQLYETHAETMAWSDLAGSVTSPRFLWKALAKNTAKRSLRNIAAAGADEAWQGALSYYGKLSPNDKFSMEQGLIEAAHGAAIGATVGVVTGQ